MFFLKTLPSLDMVRGYTGDAGAAETVLDALGMLRRASLLLRDIEQYFARHGLSQQKFLIMVVIDREPDRNSLRLSEIANRLDVSKPVLHRTIKAMTAADLLMSKPDPKDGRSDLIQLTPQAKDLLTQIMPGYFEILLGADRPVQDTG
ncbi:homoprotocatechuate degradation operon regulator, HpaR [Tritonibacter multivorans]|uniref:Homoprotocatechuate degradation operon regulator, HpaR n=1 Tax=Tritonibacter multivorans TaxID=928856 RepID=A0A0P1G322_9RHOB|nr:MarR family transcriptional regulator [Tritonibacter multivorans]MDA7419741.1 MarR family transcriptional regulator [Tritonibacter multivorans]CUH76084.1 homoprotocatechuate degradation operon regulator, HpaR [Tritonibacter multivorans]SFC55626.1 DNA-binding transcriptional regulator, MarR family [Tritonibacter multivorans]